MEEKYMKTKKIIMITMCCLICVMAIGYAAFATNLTINGTANITSTWKVLFTKIEEVSKTSGVTITKVPTAEGTNATFNVDLKSPGDKIIYKITVANQGTLDAIINDITASETGSDAIKFEISGIKKGDKLAKSTTTTFNVTISYDESVTTQPDITDNTLTVDINYVQDLGQTITDEALIIHAPRLVTKILSDNQAQSDTSIDFSQISSETNGKGLYYTSTNTEDNKVTYYFRGAVENNYVKFGEINEGTCTYKNALIIILDSDGNQIYNSNGEGSITKSLCQSTNVCEVYLDDELIGAEIGRTEEDCLALNSDESGGLKAVWTNEKAIYTSTNSGSIMWRIVRINEDGSIRLITQDSIGTSKFYEASGSGKAAYVGYMYGNPDATTYEETHANTNSSTIKDKVDSWYQTGLIDYSSYLADSGFCGDRSVIGSTGGIGIRYNEYASVRRLTPTVGKPQLRCHQNNDLYTTSTAIKGNKALTYPIGLISADEVAYAGSVVLYKNDYYLTGSSLWTMTPTYSGGQTGASLYAIEDDNTFGSFNGFASVFNIKPVINLKSTVEITSGDGTESNPYVVKTD